MNKFLAMTTAAGFVLVGAAHAQQDDALDQRAADAGILSEEGTAIDPTAPVETAETQPAASGLSEEDALTQARNEFAEADADGDDLLTQEEFVAIMSAAGDAGVSAAMTTSADAEAGMSDTVVAEADAADEGSDVTPSESGMTASDYLVAKFAMIAGDDGSLSLDELEDARRSDFADADMDGNAMLEDDEVENFAALKSGRGVY
ncbi:hypothetical protein [Parvularcula dongshanensis]|uniref:EF-hand domain-containing protein n=1 Tax=Parvularcula dongshanensis TaxID=1173995 RepID=A0A840I2I7_9PROT|nr:hypothetical protein [Parvularcula dongshanensis]MBB4659049.1 hypothetical protein [Parvularcula dongshanensis]